MENNVARRNSPEAAPEAPPPAPPARGRGRPRQWDQPQARKQAAAARRRERTQRLEELYVALLNARWDDPELARTVANGEDAEVLTALIQHFRQRHWMQPPK